MIDEADVPYNNDNFYPITDPQRRPFDFHGTHPNRFTNNSKRPQSANIRAVEAQSKKRIIKRNQMQGELRKSEEGGFIAASAPVMKDNSRDHNPQYREAILLNSSKMSKSPSKFQKRLINMEKKRDKWNSALKHEKEYLYDEAMK